MKKDTKHKVIAELRAAAKGPERSKTARLEDLFEVVTEAKAKKLRHKEIVRILADHHDLHFTMGTFEVTYSRILNKRNKSTRPAAPAPAPAPATPAALPTQPTERRPTSQSKSKPTAQDLKNIARRDIDLSEYDQ